MKKYIIIAISALFAFQGFANNVKITFKPTLVSVSDQLVDIKFGLSWENSWKSSNPKNHDAAWVFVKYSIAGFPWEHAYIDSAILTNNVAVDGTVKPGYSRVYDDDGKYLGNKKVGVFIYRKDVGAGTNDWNVTIRWNRGAQGVMADDPVVVRVFAIEMVYVPEGAFYVGDGSTATQAANAAVAYLGYNPFRSAYDATVPFKISSEATIKLVTSATTREDSLALYSASFALVPAAESMLGDTLPGTFPKGYASFYIMKHKVTQEAYVDFLNTLTISQQNALMNYYLSPTGTGVSNTANIGTFAYFNDAVRVGNKTPSYRTGVALASITPARARFVCNLNPEGWQERYYNNVDDGQNVVMSYISLRAQYAYLDWAGLRPLTELEYEKACRGTLPPVVNEYAWGNANFTTTANPPVLESGTEGAPDERPTTGTWVTYGYSNTAIRVGSFADSTTTRTNSGASYWGVMDMTGNGWVRYITVGLKTSAQFKGDHGDGRLDRLSGFLTSDLSWPVHTDALMRGVSTIPVGLSYFMWREGNQSVSSRYHTTTANAPYESSIHAIRGGRTEIENLN